jgi:hypothetical protein
MSILAGILIAAAGKVGAPLIKGVLEKHLGGAAGDLAGTIIDTIAEHAGVPVDKLPDLPPAQIEEAVRRVEEITPALILAQVEQQREANRLMLAEMDKGEAGWTWMWRPAWMYLLAFFWIWTVVVVPIVRLGTGSAVELPVDPATLMTLTGLYLGLYMGGHTIKAGIEKWKA